MPRKVTKQKTCSKCQAPVAPNSVTLLCGECKTLKRTEVTRRRKEERGPCPSCNERLPDNKKLSAKFCSDRCAAKGRVTQSRRPVSASYMRHWKYGITQEEYDTRIAAQGNACAICKSASPGGRRTQWSVDHDHTTLEVRGLLCINCNTGIGMLQDSAEIVAAALEYLNRTT